MKAISFTANFYSSAMLSCFDPSYKSYGLDKQEKTLSAEFKEKTIKSKGYDLVASRFIEPDDATIFILKRGSKRTDGRFDFLGYQNKMNVETLVEIFDKLKNKMAIEAKKARLTKNYDKKMVELNKLI